MNTVLSLYPHTCSRSHSGARTDPGSHSQLAIPGSLWVRGLVLGMWRCWGHRPHCQPATPSFWQERCCPALPVGTGWAWRVGPGLCWRGCWECCPELSERLRGHPMTGGRRCRVLTDPPRAGSLTAARGRPSACDLPLKAWFLLSPSISAVHPQSAL